MLDTSVPVVAKFRRLLDSLPRETLPDVVASMIRTSNKEKLQVLDTVSLEERFRKALPMLTRQIEGLKLLQKTRKMSPDAEKRVLSVRKGGVFPGRQFNLDEEDEDEDGDDMAALERKIHGASMPEAALRVCLKELKRLKKMPQSMPEYALTRNYLDLMVELPWSKSTKDCLDIRAARTLLDNDHYAMDKLKRRVLEYLAVRQLKTSLKVIVSGCTVRPAAKSD
ncbi:Lon protease-like protein 2 [Xenoophorus captivus]|uniref:Lon protease-like protein 2 n=1 Tax=Xenoophorus captivus TaxID=1517983 RepID=A0ABV0QHR5_9TELE